MLKNTELSSKQPYRKALLGLLFLTAIFLLQVLRTSSNKSPTKISIHVSLSEALKQYDSNNRDSQRSEEKREPKVPNSHGSYIVATGKKDSLSLMKQRSDLGVETPTILLWSGETNKDMEFVLSRKCGGCYTTRDRKWLRKSVAVILFNDIQLFSQKIPDQTTRTPEQVYVFWSRETPAKTVSFKSKLERSAFDGLFNITFFFRRDSEVLHYFGNHERALRQSKARLEKYSRQVFLESKTKDALWLVSDCNNTFGAIQRMLYARRLVEAGFKLDKFGKCFSDNRVDKKVIKERDYRYYLSFENSIHCPDYVTEKFWRNSLGHGLVPIVWGPTKADVEAIAPPHSFIFAEDFSDPKDLVEYLRYLSENNTAYMEYHKWRDTEINPEIPEENIGTGYHSSFCRLCKRLVLETHPPKIISSVSKWMYETRYVDDKCLTSRVSALDLSKGNITSLTDF